jgi:hypothetical protein
VVPAPALPVVAVVVVVAPARVSQEVGRLVATVAAVAVGVAMARPRELVRRLAPVHVPPELPLLSERAFRISV